MIAQNDLVQIDNEQLVESIKEYQSTTDNTVKQEISGLIYAYFKPLAKNIVMSFARRATDPVEDLFQVASIGILKAINTYDYQKGASFKTYASNIIISEIRHYLRDKISLVKVSRHTKELYYRISKIMENLSIEYGRTPTNEEIANALNISENKVIETIDIERRVTPISIDQIIFDNEVKEEYLIDKNAIKQYEDYISNKDYEIIIKEVLNELDKEEKEIIELIFFEGHSQVQISKELNTNAMNVSRKLKKALNSLLEKFKAKGVHIWW